MSSCYMYRRMLSRGVRLGAVILHTHNTWKPGIGLWTCLSSCSQRKYSHTSNSASNDKNCKIIVHELKSRGLLELHGRDIVEFLQGLVTNDVTELGPENPSQYAMMLNVQGRVLYDLILYENSNAPWHTAAEREKSILMECDRQVREDLMKIMKKYKIRKKVNISDKSDVLKVFAAVGTAVDLSTFKDWAICVDDPRVNLFGQRLILPSTPPVTEYLNLSNVEEADEMTYHERRYQWGIPEGTKDLPPGQCFPLESNLVFTNGVSFTKGCYIGQELTARTHHTGVTRKRLMPLVFDRPPESVPPGETIQSDKKKSVGKFRNAVGVCGLGLMRVNDIQSELKIELEDKGSFTVSAQVPPWWPQQ